METICKECINYIHIITNSAAPNVWYNHYCKAVPLKKKIDPVTGNIAYWSKNDFGMEVESDVKYNYCRNINYGNCALFVERTKNV